MNFCQNEEQFNVQLFLINTRIPPMHSNIAMYFYRGHSARASLGKGEEEHEESNQEQKDIERRACSQKSDIPHTNSMYFFL